MAGDYPPSPSASVAVGRAPGPLELAPDQLVALLGISQALSKHRDREALFAAIAASIEGLLPADRLVVLVPGAHADAVASTPCTAPRSSSKGSSIPEGSVPAWVIRHRQAMLVSSPEQVRDSFPGDAPEARRRGDAVGALVLPLLRAATAASARSASWRAPPASSIATRGACSTSSPVSVAIALDGCLAYEQLQRLGQERAGAARSQRRDRPPPRTRRALRRAGRVPARSGADRALRHRAADRGRPAAGPSADAARRAGGADAADGAARRRHRVQLGPAEPCSGWSPRRATSCASAFRSPST